MAADVKLTALPAVVAIVVATAVLGGRAAPRVLGALMAAMIPVGGQDAQVERVVEAGPAELARGHFRAAKVAVRDAAGEAAVCGSLRSQRFGVGPTGRRAEV